MGDAADYEEMKADWARHREVLRICKLKQQQAEAHERERQVYRDEGMTEEQIDHVLEVKRERKRQEYERERQARIQEYGDMPF